MKKHTNPFKLLALGAFFLLPVLSMAGNGDVVQKRKNISKSYTVSADDKLSIENSFGDVTITTWDKNEIQVNIDIMVNASTDDKAQQMMDQIQVSDSRSGNTISFKTDIGNMGNGKKNKDNGGDDRKFAVDYKIVMPAGNPLNVENSFGKINIGNFNGPASLVSKFGELNTGKLANAKVLHVEFGKADIGPVVDPDITFKFNGKSFIKNISGNAKVHVEFCGDVAFSVDNGIRDLSIFESYSDVRVFVPQNISANVNVHTNFGSFHNSSGINISEEKDDDSNGPKFDRDYSGSSGTGTARIKIKSSFGKVRIANVGDTTVNGDDDHQDHSKNKNKNKDKDDDDDDDSVNM
ncbi:MAG TPA: hypothetical protein VG890_07025 [Puia sp.]|nr:hypothetical protein [Puia sp.]